MIALRCMPMMMENKSQLYQKEADLTKAVQAWFAIQRDVKSDKICDRYKKGIADFLLCVQGKYVAIELKAAKGKESPHQKLFIKEVIRAGGIGGTCYTLDEVIALVDEARRRP